VLDPKSRRRLPRVACSAYGAGLIAQLAKPLVPRLRPHVCDLSASVWRTFFLGGADQYAQLNSLSGRDVYSFPSGHSATAVGLAFGLTWLYPPGRWLFTFYAFLAMMQRIESGSHFVSDTFAGAAVACLAAAFCWGRGKLDRVFVSLERPHASSRAVAGGAATCQDVESAGGQHADCR
ncbi:MAG: phosphatase PAP2 family protein, partial [Planctomycetota bacterium]